MHLLNLAFFQIVLSEGQVVDNSGPTHRELAYHPAEFRIAVRV